MRFFVFLLCPVDLCSLELAILC